MMDEVLYLMDSLWTMVAAILVIFMIAGFIMLEAGSTRMKNAGHVAGKTVFTFGLAVTCILGCRLCIYLRW